MVLLFVEIVALQWLMVTYLHRTPTMVLKSISRI